MSSLPKNSIRKQDQVECQKRTEVAHHQNEDGICPNEPKHEINEKDIIVIITTNSPGHRDCTLKSKYKKDGESPPPATPVRRRAPKRKENKKKIVCHQMKKTKKEIENMKKIWRRDPFKGLNKP